MPHIGLRPQRAVFLAGFKVQGKDVDNACSLVDDGLALQDACTFAVVVEAVPKKILQDRDYREA
jgi:3-methyl-2-oxobutanoate hydroxymethyltransferase